VRLDFEVTTYRCVEASLDLAEKVWQARIAASLPFSANDPSALGMARTAAR